MRELCATKLRSTGMEDAAVRVLIVDDEALARARLQNLLEDVVQEQAASPNSPSSLDFARLAHMEVTQAQDALQAIALLH